MKYLAYCTRLLITTNNHISNHDRTLDPDSLLHFIDFIFSTSVTKLLKYNSNTRFNWRVFVEFDLFTMVADSNLAISNTILIVNSLDIHILSENFNEYVIKL